MLTKKEIAFILPAVLYRWRITIQHWQKNPCWDDDPQMPVKIGKVCESLIERGYLERVMDSHYPNHGFIRSTQKADDHRCKQCHHGEVYDNNDIAIGKCPYCYRGLIEGNTDGKA